MRPKMGVRRFEIMRSFISPFFHGHKVRFSHIVELQQSIVLSCHLRQVGIKSRHISGQN